MDSIDENVLNETILDENSLDETRYLDCLDVSSNSVSLVSSETSTFEEFETQVEVVPVPKGTLFTFDWNILFQPNRLHPRLEELIYWRDAMKSGLIFVTGFFILSAIDRFSIIFVVPFFLLHIMLASVACRMYKAYMLDNSNNHSEEVDGMNPDFGWVEEYENMVVTLPRDKVQLVTGLTVEGINELIGHLKNLFLFKNPYDSMHFSLLLISLALMGKMINGTTVLLFSFIFLFTIPKLYEIYKPAVDAKLDLMRTNLTSMVNKFRGHLQ